MRYAGQGRIVLWEGASLWAFDVPPPDLAIRPGTDLHAHHAIQVTLSVDGRFSLRLEDAEVSGPAVVIAPDVPHAYQSQGKNAMIFIEPESRIGAAILADLGGRKLARIEAAPFADLTSRLGQIWQDPRPDDAVLAGLGRALAARLAGDIPAARAMDARIARVILALGQDAGLQMGAGRAAEIACLSDSRFSHLFVAEVGLPFRTYLLWRRLMGAVSAIAAGASLTRAAHEAGFADQAHFSRTFLRMFGVPASLLRMI